MNYVDSSTPDFVHLKVGRAVNLVKRLDQWDKQCGSKDKEQVLRGWWPGSVDPEGTESGDSLMKGRIIAGEKGAWCHRLERLIHIELADLVVFQPYLNPEFPDGGPGLGAASPGAAANGKKKCPDCKCSCYTALNALITCFRWYHPQRNILFQAS